MSSSWCVLAGLLVGASTAVVVPLDGTCKQTFLGVLKCANDCCVDGTINGPPPAGWGMFFTGFDCQGTSSCADCCLLVSVEVEGTNAYGVATFNCNTGTQEQDFSGTPPYIVYPFFEAPCMTNTSTSNCLQLNGFWATSVVGMKTLCLQLDCTKCQ